MDVVCTAGHVDHGKSTLVRALTGMEPDRFDEEKRRGLTIDLGFAWMQLGGGADARTVAFVDLPGHERFVPNMLAGAGPVEVTLFVVAADEGWKPQSQEHLDILDLLDIPAGVVALSKADTVSPEELDAAHAAVRARLDGSRLRDSDIVAVSAATGAGLDDLRAALERTLRSRPPVTDRGLARLWVDRSFTVKGAGTVVTGTLTGGPLRTGDDVVVRPAEMTARVRGLQSLKSPVTAAAVGDRVAVNLAGLGRDDVQRGHTVTDPRTAPPTAAVDAWIRVLAPHRIGRRGAWHLHAGSGEWRVRVRPLDTAEISDEGLARLLLDSAVPLATGDRFVLRDSGRRTTAGGGLILDAAPPALRGAPQRRSRVEALRGRHAALAQDDRSTLLVLHVTERGAVAQHEAAAAAGLAPDTAAEAAESGGLLRLGDSWVAPVAVADWTAGVVTALADHHRRRPLDRVAPRDVAVSAASDAGAPQRLVAELLTVLGRLGRIVMDGPGVRLPDHRVQLSSHDERARQALLATLDDNPFAPPDLDAAAARAGASPALVRELEASGDLVRLGPTIAVSAAALRLADERLRALAASEGPFTAAQAKEALGTTRKFAVPLLEELDRRGVTRRKGDMRHVP